MFISHGYAMLMPNVKVKVGQTADSFEKCVVPAVNAVRQMGFTNGKFGALGPQLRRVRDVEPDHAHEHLRRGGVRRDAAGAVSQLGERPRPRFAQHRDRSGADGRQSRSSIPSATSRSRRSFISTR